MNAPDRQLSAHFSLREMLESAAARTSDGIWAQQCAPPDVVVAHLEILCRQVLEPLREALGGWPILVNSGYRCRDLNALVGGSRRSQHCAGQAADIRLAPGFMRSGSMAAEEARAALATLWASTIPVPDRAPDRDGWLWLAAAYLAPELGVHQVIHERGVPWAPRWVHISWRDEPAGRLSAIGAWTGESYRHWSTRNKMARDLNGRSAAA